MSKKIVALGLVVIGAMSVFTTGAIAATKTLRPGQNYAIGTKWKNGNKYYRYYVRYAKNGTAYTNWGTYKNAVQYIKQVR